MKPRNTWGKEDWFWVFVAVVTFGVQVWTLFSSPYLFQAVLAVVVIALWVWLLYLRFVYEYKRQLKWKAEMERLDRAFEAELKRIAKRKK